MKRTLTLAAALLLAPWAALHAAGPAVTIELGSPEVVLADQALGLRYFPDGRLTVVRTQPDCRVLLAAGISSYLLEGPAMGNFTRATQVLGKGARSEFDNGYCGINAAVRARTGELLAFYHAEDQEDMKTVGGGIPGFYCSIGLAVSKDDGTSFEKRGPVLTGQLPKNPGGRADQGVGEVSVLAEPGGEYLYAYYTSHEPVGGRGVQICLARCPVADAQKTGAWRKYHELAFTEPGLGGKDTPVVTSGHAQADALFPHVIYLPALHQFMMTFCVNAWSEGAKPERSGLYTAFSADGIHWPREQMQQLWKVPVVAAIGREVAWHPTYIPGASESSSGWLYYACSQDWGHQSPHQPHSLVRRPMAVRAKAQ